MIVGFLPRMCRLEKCNGGVESTVIRVVDTKGCLVSEHKDSHTMVPVRLTTLHEKKRVLYHEALPYAYGYPWR